MTSGSYRTAPPTEQFGQFQYLTVPLHVSDDFMNTALRKALAPALDPDPPEDKDR
jgi:hypothetical protein